MLTNQVFNVSYVKVTDENDNVVPDYLIVEPRHYYEDYLSGVAILPIVDNKIGLIQIFRPALNRTLFEIPHGFIEPGETSAEACMRELVEETGIVCTEEEITNLGLVAPDSGVIRGTVMLFLAKTKLPETHQISELGLGSLIFLEVKDVINLIKSNKILDSFTQLAIMKALYNKQITL